MTLLDPALPEEPGADRALRLARLYRTIGRADKWFRLLGLAWITPIWRLLAGDNPRGQLPEIWRLAVVPMLAVPVSGAMGQPCADGANLSRGRARTCTGLGSRPWPMMPAQRQIG